MPPSNGRDFYRAGAQRLASAQVLLSAGHTLDAQYLGGYAVECSLKALILHHTPSLDLPAMLLRIRAGASMHRPETLLGILGEYSIRLPIDLARRMRRFDWTTDLRYETGRRSRGQTRGLLRTAHETLLWVEGQLP